MSEKASKNNTKSMVKSTKNKILTNQEKSTKEKATKSEKENNTLKVKNDKSVLKTNINKSILKPKNSDIFLKNQNNKDSLKPKNKPNLLKTKTKSTKNKPLNQAKETKRIRLSKDERKEQILLSSMQVFKQLGFINTTMEDIVKACELSKGGVYYHYQNTIDILHDLMILGIKYRVDIIKQSLNEPNNEKNPTNITCLKEQTSPNNKSQNPPNVTCLKNQNKNTRNKFCLDFYANEIFKKIIDDNPFMDIYVDFLYAKKDSPKLESLFNELKAENKKEFLATFDDTSCIMQNYDLLTDFINSLILGANSLNAKENFIKNEKLIKLLIKTLLKGVSDAL